MRLETALNKQRAAVQAVRDTIGTAKITKPTSAHLDEKLRQRLADILGDKCPRHVTEYVHGYRDALSRALYETDLIFGAYVDGVFYSTHSTRADYYEKHGISAQAYCMKTRDKQAARVGHYWSTPGHDGNMRPYFVGEC